MAKEISKYLTQKRFMKSRDRLRRRTMAPDVAERIIREDGWKGPFRITGDGDLVDSNGGYIDWDTMGFGSMEDAEASLNLAHRKIELESENPGNP